MLVKLKHKLKPNPLPTPKKSGESPGTLQELAKPLRPYMTKNVCTVGGNPASAEILGILKEIPKPMVHIAKRRVKQ